MLPTQEPKYVAKYGDLINRATGLKIPDDEPVFIFRARDVLAVPTLQFYLKQVLKEHTPAATEHAAAILERIDHFQTFAKNYPERMKSPDTTKVEGLPVEGCPIGIQDGSQEFCSAGTCPTCQGMRGTGT